MQRAQIATALSFLVSAAGIFGSLLSTSGMRAEVYRDPLTTYAALAVASVVLGWPWFGTFFAASKPEAAAGSAVVFSIMSAVFSLSFAPFISGAPAEGVGWYIIICLILIWAVYFATAKMRETIK